MRREKDIFGGVTEGSTMHITRKPTVEMRGEPARDEQKAQEKETKAMQIIPKCNGSYVHKCHAEIQSLLRWL